MLHEKQDREDPCSSEKLQFTVKKHILIHNQISDEDNFS